jgi:hypothetical protein
VSQPKASFSCGFGEFIPPYDAVRAGDDLEADAALAQILINRSESNDDKGNPSAA